MNKSKKNILILAIVLFICIIAYVGIRLMSTYNAQKEEESAASSTIPVGAIADASEMSFYNGTETLSFTYRADTDSWILTGDTSAEIDDTTLKSIAGTVVGLTADRSINFTETDETLESYGLADPLTLRVEDSSGNVLSLLIGMINGNRCYGMLEKDPTTIYLLPSSIATNISKQLNDFLVLETFPIIYETDVEDITITKGKETLTLYKEYTDPENSESYLWKVAFGTTDAAVSNLNLRGTTGTAQEHVDRLLTSLSTMTFDSIAEYKAIEKAQNSYGVDKPQYIITITYTDSTGNAGNVCTLSLGNGIFDPENSEADAPYMYYAVLDNSTTVNYIASATVSPMLDLYETFTTSGSVITQLPGTPAEGDAAPAEGTGEPAAETLPADDLLTAPDTAE